MKREIGGPPEANKACPHVISRIGGRRNYRWPVLMGNGCLKDPNDGTWVVSGPGCVGREGEPSAQGRRALFRQVGERARTSKARYCIVWSETECSFFLPDGSIRDGYNPPAGDFVPESSAWETAPIVCEPVWSMALNGRGPGYLCIKRTGDLVEVMAGERIILADFSEYPAGADDDPAAALRDKRGRWKRPLVHRGQRVETITDRGVLLGPVQPLEMGPVIVLRSPWPDELAAACAQVAGRRLPNAVLQAAWTAVDPADTMQIKDILDAA